MNANPSSPDAGKVWPSLDDALAAGQRATDLVEVTGTPTQVAQLSAAVRRDAKARRRAATKRKAARASRRHNRRP